VLRFETGTVDSVMTAGGLAEWKPNIVFAPVEIRTGIGDMSN